MCGPDSLYLAFLEVRSQGARVPSHCHAVCVNTQRKAFFSTQMMRPSGEDCASLGLELQRLLAYVLSHAFQYLLNKVYIFIPVCLTPLSCFSIFS